jgi:hypothetical protein
VLSQEPKDQSQSQQGVRKKNHTQSTKQSTLRRLGNDDENKTIIVTKIKVTI